MKILITGASSYVGAKIYSGLKNKFEVVGTYYTNKLFSELNFLDIRNKSEVEESVNKIRPDIIIHVAANASGSWCDKNPEQALAINQEGTKNIANAANNLNSKIIFISSFASTDAGSLYGRTKNAGENFVKNVKAGYVILRPSLIVGFSPNTVNDRLFNRILKNITDKTPAVYDTSWKFQPTWLRHVSEVIQIIIEKDIINEIISISVPEIKTRYDIAKDILVDFKIEVKSEDKKDSSPSFSDNLSKLKELKLPIYTYSQMVEGIKQEIRNYLKI